MTKKHFIALADELRRERQHFIMCHGEAAFNEMVSICVSFCRGENGRFKSDVFRGYINGDCGPCGGEIRKK